MYNLQKREILSWFPPSFCTVSGVESLPELRSVIQRKPILNNEVKKVGCFLLIWVPEPKKEGGWEAFLRVWERGKSKIFLLLGV